MYIRKYMYMQITENSIEIFFFILHFVTSNLL